MKMNYQFSIDMLKLNILWLKYLICLHILNIKPLKIIIFTNHPSSPCYCLLRKSNYSCVYTRNKIWSSEVNVVILQLFLF